MSEKHSPPQLSVSLAIEPASFVVQRGNKDPPILSMTVTLHASQPITIFTWATIFNLSLAQHRHNFTCFDLTRGWYKNTKTTNGPRRLSFDRTRGSSDDKYFCTLEPGVPVTFKGRFALAQWGLALPEGHRYRFAVSKQESVNLWWYGRRKDVMASRSVLEWPVRFIRKHRRLLKSSGDPIDVSAASPVDFEILARDPDIELPPDLPHLGHDL